MYVLIKFALKLHLVRCHNRQSSKREKSDKSLENAILLCYAYDLVAKSAYVHYKALCIHKLCILLKTSNQSFHFSINFYSYDVHNWKLRKEVKDSQYVFSMYSSESR